MTQPRNLPIAAKGLSKNQHISTPSWNNRNFLYSIIMRLCWSIFFLCLKFFSFQCLALYYLFLLLPFKRWLPRSLSHRCKICIWSWLVQVPMSSSVSSSLAKEGAFQVRRQPEHSELFSWSIASQRGRTVTRDATGILWWKPDLKTPSLHHGFPHTAGLLQGASRRVWPTEEAGWAHLYPATWLNTL